MTRTIGTVAVSVSTQKVAFDEVERTAAANRKGIATVTQAIMNLAFLEKVMGSWVFVDWRRSPFWKVGVSTEEGWYKIDREKGLLIKITDEQVKELGWYEKIYAEESVAHAIVEKRPLALVVGKDGLRLSGYYNFQDRKEYEEAQRRMERTVDGIYGTARIAEVSLESRTWVMTRKMLRIESQN